MNEQMPKIPDRIVAIEPPPALLGKVLRRIDREKVLYAAKKRLVVFGVLFSGSVVAGIPMISAFQAQLAQSGFVQYVALLFSDFQSIVAHWQDFGLTLLETLPAITLAGTLTVILTMLISLRAVIGSAQTFFNVSQRHTLPTTYGQ
ncbi:MAG: hypothetical protein PHI63_05645 [Patescibacteria group bacterium]|nr:hypothetical protein [Patescibacteria group bacterium]